jgi:taurine dioxygenase
VTVTLQIEHLAPAVGARVTGIDLSQAIDAASARQLREAFVKYGVLCLPQPDLEPEHQEAFAALFGKADSGARQSTDPNKMQSERGVMYVSNIRENGKPIGVLPDGEMHFHSDGSHRENPYRATALYALKVPSRGGETKFAAMAAAYEALPADEQERLATMKACHVFNYNKTTRADLRRDDDAQHAIHPLVKVHPDSGQRSLYLSRLMTRNIVGMDDDESEALLLKLFDHCERPEFVYAHPWAVGDLVIWDNRSVNHARNDFPADEPRLLRRYTISDPD